MEHRLIRYMLYLFLAVVAIGLLIPSKLLWNPATPLPTPGGQQWDGSLSAYPGGQGAIPYMHPQSSSGTLEWYGGANPLYGGH